MQSCRPSSFMHDASFEFIDRLDRSVLHDVIHIPMKQSVRVKGILNRSVQGKICVVEEILAIECLFNGSNPGVGERDVSLVFVESKVHAALHSASHLID